MRKKHTLNLKDLVKQNTAADQGLVEDALKLARESGVQPGRRYRLVIPYGQPLNGSKPPLERTRFIKTK